MSEPTLIVGPAIIQHNGLTIYTEGNIVERIRRDTIKRKTSMVGEYNTILKTQLVELEFTPAGMMGNPEIAKLLPYAPADIGTNIFDKPTTKTVVIWTKAGKKITYTNGTISKMPTLRLGVLNTWLGPMTITCKANGAVEYTDAAAWNAVTSVAFSDTSFDDTLVRTGRYLATWGSIFADEGSQDGFEVDYNMTTEALSPDGFNIVGMILTGLQAIVRFKPISWTEANFFDYLRLQGADAILPGESISKMLSDMTITSTTSGLTVVVNKVGPATGEQGFDLAGYRQGQQEFHSRLSWSAGVLQPIVTPTFET